MNIICQSYRPLTENSKNIEEAVAEVEESHTVTLPTEHSYVRIYGAMCAVIREDGDMLSDGYSVFQRNLQYLKEEYAKISCSASRKCMVLQGLMFFPSFRSASCRL